MHFQHQAAGVEDATELNRSADGRTTLRGSAGRYIGRVPLPAKGFGQFPARVDATFDPVAEPASRVYDGRYHDGANPRVGSADAARAIVDGCRGGVGEITKLVDSGVLRPIVDRTYPFDQAPQALAHVDGGRSKGKVVITMV